MEESAEDLTSSAEPTTDDSSDGNGRDETSSGGEKEDPKNIAKKEEVNSAAPGTKCMSPVSLASY